MAEKMSSTTHEEITCFICIGRLKEPRTLTCLHTFCQKCLSSYIETSDYKLGDKPCFNCPQCQSLTYPPADENNDPKEWASLFPQNTALLALLGEDKPKVDCSSCSSEARSSIATGLCVECIEYLCESCINDHRKVRAVKSHRVWSLDDMSNVHDVIKHMTESYNCTIHKDEQIEYFCKIHKTVCCIKCSIIYHRNCSEFIDLKTSASTALDEDPGDIVEMLTRIEGYLSSYMQSNKSTQNRIESQTNEIVSTIRYAREQVNNLFDVIENEVKQKRRQIYDEETNKLNHIYRESLSQLTAVHGSRQLLDAILRLGNETQVFLTARQTKLQLTNYREQIVKKYTYIESKEITLTLHDSLKTLMSIAADQLATIQTQIKVDKLSLDGIFRTPTLDSVIETKCPNSGSTPSYRGSAWLCSDFILLSDYMNSKCCLYSPEYTHLADYTLKETWDVCSLAEGEVAVTATNAKKIQFLTCTSTITPTRSFTTRYYCDGIAALSEDKLVISGYNDSGNKNYYWSILTTQGKEEYYHEIDQKGGTVTYLAINESKTRLYMSCHDTDTVYCFGLNGQVHFVYTNEQLKGPMGIGVDRDNYLYVAGYQPNNIHQILPDGNLIQIITIGIPEWPRKLTFDKSGNRFLLTNKNGENHIYVLK
ncbi:hypothetical protein ACJMK2_026928 [Sinanodonta woodiana]|uniref:RING-type domain-containing protein n=1 Tax=Sinanodonta woodiana TaxID=1069815 RepID=A0ABD3XPI3_SINWO